MLVEGVRLMAVGMFTVFVFLTLMVGVMHATAAFFAAHADRFPEPSVEGGAGARNDRGVAVALAAAHAARERGRP